MSSELQILEHQCDQARADYKGACELCEQAEHRFIEIADKNDVDSPEYIEVLKVFGAAWQKQRVADRCLCVLNQQWLDAVKTVKLK